MVSLANILSWDSLRNVSAVLGALAVIATSLGVINTKVVAPFLAKPIAKAIRNELTEAVEAIILSDLIMGQLEEMVQEVVTSESKAIIAELAKHDHRLIAMERTQEAMMKELRSKT